MGTTQKVRNAYVDDVDGEGSFAEPLKVNESGEVVVKQYTGALESSGIESGNMLVNMQQILFVGIIVIVFVIFASLCALVCRKHKDKIQSKLGGMKSKFVYNGIIRSISIGYMNFGIAAVVKIQDMQRSPETATIGSIATAAGLVVFLFGYFIVSLVWLIRNRAASTLEDPETIAKFGNWYVGTEYNKKKWAVLYYPLFILRRFLFLMWPVLLVGHPSQQIQMLLLFDMFYVMLYVNLWPQGEG